MGNKLATIVAMLIALLLLSKCDYFQSGSPELKKQALEYFTQKYNIDKSDIKVEKNMLYDKTKHCIDSCGDNTLRIKYKDEEYVIHYDRYKEIFGDNYQLKEIYSELVKFLNDKFSYANMIKVDNYEADITGNSIKYEGNIEEYYKKLTNLRYTYVKIWLKADDKDTAKELNNKYSKEICNILNKMGLSYTIGISNKYDDNEYSAHYYYHSYRDVVYFYDRVDNHRKQYSREVPYPIEN
jgi:hypothetical protein